MTGVGVTKPFLKWAGGKRWLAKDLVKRFPESFNRYIEPFLGSAAVFFELRPSAAIISDANGELVATYQVIRDFPEELHNALRVLHDSHSAETYYVVRGTRPIDPINVAARFIYLNRTCWNGLYRVNRRNEFNVPIGTKSTVIFPDDDFVSTSTLLKAAEIIHSDFEAVIDRGEAGDIIYVDPPYTVKHNNNGFVKYNQLIFSWDDQIRLRDALRRAHHRGCYVAVSNADHGSVRELYADFGMSLSLPRSSIIAGAPGARGQTSELLVINHG